MHGDLYLDLEENGPWDMLFKWGSYWPSVLMNELLLSMAVSSGLCASIICIVLMWAHHCQSITLLSHPA